jgi:hypothetical protein
MQVMAEQLTEAGVNVFVSDVKGDASGFCVAAFEQGEKPSDIEMKWNARNKIAPFEPIALGVDYWSVSNRFIPLRFSVSQAGSILFSRLLSLNPTQESHLAIAFSHARKNKIALDSVEELLALLDGMVAKKERGISASSISVIERKLVALEESGLWEMFGRPSLEIADLQGLNALNLSDMRKNMVASIAPAFLINKLFNELPEAGDVEVPKYAIFFDEAHYLFKDANKSLKDLMVTILKQIRSKGVAVFFVTQDVTDLPEEILSQLATKIIFSQKVFTEKGTKRLSALAKSFPRANKKTMEMLKSMPTGVALVSTLDEKGNQTAAAQVKIFAPATTMEIVADETLLASTDPELVRKYSRTERAAQARLPKEEKSFAFEKPEKVEMLEPEKKKLAITGEKRARPSIVDSLFSFLLKLLDFILKAGGTIAGKLIIKPLVSFFKYLAKKPIRIAWFILLLILLYAIIVNLGTIQSFLNSLKLS